jgi:hypothetical protein
VLLWLGFDGFEVCGEVVCGAERGATCTGAGLAWDGAGAAAGAGAGAAGAGVGAAAGAGVELVVVLCRVAARCLCAGAGFFVVAVVFGVVAVCVELVCLAALPPQPATAAAAARVVNTALFIVGGLLGVARTREPTVVAGVAVGAQISVGRLR